MTTPTTTYRVYDSDTTEPIALRPTPALVQASLDARPTGHVRATLREVVLNEVDEVEAVLDLAPDHAPDGDTLTVYVEEI